VQLAPENAWMERVAPPCSTFPRGKSKATDKKERPQTARQVRVKSVDGTDWVDQGGGVEVRQRCVAKVCE